MLRESQRKLGLFAWAWGLEAPTLWTAAAVGYCAITAGLLAGRVRHDKR
jgi:hypothetical protein